MRWRNVLVALCLTAAIAVGHAQQPQLAQTPQQAGATRFREPRFPSYLKAANSVDELMPQARAYVSLTQGVQGYGMGNFKSGDTLLFVPDVTAEPNPLEAIRRALAERGVKVIIKSEAEMVGLTRDDAEAYRKLTQIPSAQFGFLEARNYWLNESPRVWSHPDVAISWLRNRKPDLVAALFPKGQEFSKDSTAESNKLYSANIGNAIRLFLEQHSEVTALYWGKPGAGFSGPRALGAQGVKRHGASNTTFANYYFLASAIPTYPGDVVKLIEKKTTEKLTSDIDIVHVTDAEGTDLTWNLTPEMLARWLKGLPASETSHLAMYPDTATGKFAPATGPDGQREWVPRAPIAGATGVIAGTNGSGGFWPRMEIAITNGSITRVTGGGKYGDVIREFLQYPHINDVTYPYYDKPGFWHLWEMALGSQPKNFRDPADFYGGGHAGVYCLTFERYRAGVVHWGFGNEISEEPGSVGQPVQWLKFGDEQNLPTGHDFHIQNYFITYKVHRKSTGQWVTIVDGGHLTALDDPEVRALAAKYGDPDRILAEDWVPEVPGINAPGRYADYARDPWSFADAQMQKILNGTYEHYYPRVTVR